MLLTKKTDREYGKQNKHILCEQMSSRDWECNWTPSGLELSSSSHSYSPTHTSALSTGKKTSDLSFDGWRNMDLNPLTGSLSTEWATDREQQHIKL